MKPLKRYFNAFILSLISVSCRVRAIDSGVCRGLTFPRVGLGGVVKPLNISRVDSFEDCCSRCIVYNSTKGSGNCSSWVFISESDTYKKGPGDCHLLNYSGNPSKANRLNKISGHIQSRPLQQCSNQFVVHENSHCSNATSVGGNVGKGNTEDDCCQACLQHSSCFTWNFYVREGGCKLFGACQSFSNNSAGRKTGIRLKLPPLPPPPLPPRVKPGSQKNIILLLTDDQDLRLGSMVAMPYTAQHIGASGANLSNFFVNTPICCPSRSTLLSGRWNHNIRGPAGYKGCMNMNVSRDDDPSWWENTFVSRLRRDHGYATGMFGKVLNVMDTYGCKTDYKTPHMDRALIMCNHNYFNEHWADDRDPYRVNNDSYAVNTTGDLPNEYTTSIIGNASIAWMKSVIDSGPDHPPFFVYLGPHAPHKPSIVAPWYKDHPIGNTPIVKGPYFNYLATGKHAFLPFEPQISPVDLEGIKYEHSLRLRTLLSVDDVVKGIREYLLEVGEWDRTYFIFTSDHGNFLIFTKESHEFCFVTCI